MGNIKHKNNPIDLLTYKRFDVVIKYLYASNLSSDFYKNAYKELISEYMRKNSKLEQENTKLRIALCNLRDEYLDMGGDPKQLELFDENDPSQLKLDFEIVKTSESDFEVK